MLLFQLGICIFGCGSLEKMTRISLRTGSGLVFNSKCVQYFYCTRSCIIKALYVYRVAAPRSHYRSNICSAVQLTRTENRVTGSSHISISSSLVISPVTNMLFLWPKFSSALIITRNYGKPGSQARGASRQICV